MHCKLMSSCRLQWQVNLVDAFTLIVTFRTCGIHGIYAKEDDDSNI